jgi:thioredoxin 1
VKSETEIVYEMNTTELNEANFETEVLKANETVVVDFWAPWCGPCKMLAPVLDELAREQGGRVKIGKVNVDENQALAQRYNVQSIPTLLYFRGGEVRHQAVGLISKKVILSALEQLAAPA